LGSALNESVSKIARTRKKDGSGIFWTSLVPSFDYDEYVYSEEFWNKISIKAKNMISEIVSFRGENETCYAHDRDNILWALRTTFFGPHEVFLYNDFNPILEPSKKNVESKIPKEVYMDILYIVFLSTLTILEKHSETIQKEDNYLSNLLIHTIYATKTILNECLFFNSNEKTEEETRPFKRRSYNPIWILNVNTEKNAKTLSVLKTYFVVDDKRIIKNLKRSSLQPDCTTNDMELDDDSRDSIMEDSNRHAFYASLGLESTTKTKLAALGCHPSLEFEFVSDIYLDVIIKDDDDRVSSSRVIISKTIPKTREKTNSSVENLPAWLPNDAARLYSDENYIGYLIKVAKTIRFVINLVINGKTPKQSKECYKEFNKKALKEYLASSIAKLPTRDPWSFHDPSQRIDLFHILSHRMMRTCQKSNHKFRQSDIPTTRSLFSLLKSGLSMYLQNSNDLGRNNSKFDWYVTSKRLYFGKIQYFGYESAKVDVWHAYDGKNDEDGYPIILKDLPTNVMLMSTNTKKFMHSHIYDGTKMEPIIISAFKNCNSSTQKLFSCYCNHSAAKSVKDYRGNSQLVSRFIDDVEIRDKTLNWWRNLASERLLDVIVSSSILFAIVFSNLFMERKNDRSLKKNTNNFYNVRYDPNSNQYCKNNMIRIYKDVRGEVPFLSGYSSLLFMLFARNLFLYSFVGHEGKDMCRFLKERSEDVTLSDSLNFLSNRIKAYKLDFLHVSKAVSTINGEESILTRKNNSDDDMGKDVYESKYHWEKSVLIHPNIPKNMAELVALDRFEWLGIVSIEDGIKKKIFLWTKDPISSLLNLVFEEDEIVPSDHNFTAISFEAKGNKEGIPGDVRSWGFCNFKIYVTYRRRYSNDNLREKHSKSVNENNSNNNNNTKNSMEIFIKFVDISLNDIDVLLANSLLIVIPKD
jgi:hypothetical protein